MKVSKSLFLAMFIFMFCFSSGYAQVEKGIIDTIAERIEFHGELEAGFWLESIGHKNRSGRVEDSEIQLTTACLAIEAEVTDWMNITVVPLFEVDEFFIDEGHVTLGPTENIPLYLTAGLLYHPFGKREEYTHFPDDPFINLPLTLYFGEIWDPGVIIGYTQDFGPSNITLEGFAVYADVSDSEENRQVDTFGFNLCYNISTEDYSFEIGGSWINNVLDSSGFKDYFDEEGAWDGEFSTEKDIDGVAVYASGEYRGLYFTAEYMTATSTLERQGLIGRSGEKGARPRVWGVEVGAALENYVPLPKPVEVMFRYEGSLDAQEIYEIPRNRYAVGANIGLHDYLTWSLAYAYNDYNEGYGGGDPTGNPTNGSLFFTQMAIEF